MYEKREGENMFKFLLTTLMSLSVTVSAMASITAAPKGMAVDSGDMEKIQTISTLEKDIEILDAEIAKCNKQKKGWIAGTVIGSVGVAATAIAAGVQGAQINKKKNELMGHNADIEDRQQELDSLR